MDGYPHYARSWSLRKMRQLVQACNRDYVCWPQLAFRLSTYARPTLPPSSPTMKISPSQCNARSLSTTTRRHLPKTIIISISRGCLVGIAGCSMTWNPFFQNRTCQIPIKPDCCTQVVTTAPFHRCGWVFAALRVGMRFRDRILVGYPV